MNFKRISSAALALTMTAALGAPALADERPEGWTPADGARVMPISAPVEDNLLISPAPSGMPEVNVPAPGGAYNTVITVNGKQVESLSFDREVPGWGSTTITWALTELDTVPAGYVPLRAIVDADHGDAYWYREENQSWFSLGDERLTVSFEDMSVSLNDEKLEGVSAILLHGVTYAPVTVFNSMEGVSVTDNSAEGVESYEITTPNGTPIMKLAYELMETAGMGMGMKQTVEDLELFWGEGYGFQADMITEGVAFLPMMTTPDTLVLGKVAEGKTEALQAVLESHRKTQEDTFSWYLSHNLPKVENAKFVTEGDWFLFLIAENADEAVEAFRAAVKDMQ